MATRQPRRTRRRRAAPAASLPRPVPGEAQPGSRAARSVSASGHREHHITADYSYVRRDLVAVTIISILSLGFIVAAALSIGSL